MNVPATTKPTAAVAPRSRITPVEHRAADALWDPASLGHLFEVARVMAASNLTPEHLRGERTNGQFKPYAREQAEANCFLVVNQAAAWGMNPLLIAPETYVVGGKLAFQGKLIAAVVNSRAGLVSRLKFSFEGTGDDLRCTASGQFAGDTQPRTVTVALKQARTGNELWKKDPEQKLIYTTAIRWARRHCPDVLMGVITELEYEEPIVVTGRPLPPAAPAMTAEPSPTKASPVPALTAADEVDEPVDRQMADWHARIVAAGSTAELKAIWAEVAKSNPSPARQSTVRGWIDGRRQELPVAKPQPLVGGELPPDLVRFQQRLAACQSPDDYQSLVDAEEQLGEDSVFARWAEAGVMAQERLLALGG